MMERSFHDGKRLYEEVTRDDAVKKMIERFEKEHKSKVKRIPRTASHDGKFFMTIILENYEMLEVTLSPSSQYVFGKPSINVDVEVY
jgi:hypothetical protein